MELRRLTSKDIFPICGILKKIGIKDIKDVLNGSNIIELATGGKKVSAEAISMDIMLDLFGLIISNLPDCQNQIYSFLESIIVVEDEKERRGLRKKLEDMEMGEFTELVMDVLKKEEFRDFFKVALKSLK